jgi:hypothetical protein
VPCFFSVTGLTSASLCQKSKEKITDLIDNWNSQVGDETQNEIEISINHYRQLKKKAARFRVLLIIEPTVTWPKNRKKNMRHYDLVVAAAPSSQNLLTRPWFNRPVETFTETSDPALRKRKFTIVAADKYSLVSGELYSLRRLVAIRKSELIEVYGDGWERGAHERLRTLLGELLLVISSGRIPKFSGLINFLFQKVASQGVVATKQEAYNRNAFALVIENSMELRTEKLYDAIESCSIPVYVGPDVEDGIPRGLYIQAEPTLSKVLAAMESAMHVDIEQWKTARDNWMKTESYLNSDTERFNQLLRELSDHFEIAEK